MLVSPVATPRPIRPGRSCLRTELNLGRKNAMNMPAPAMSLIHAAPPGPTDSTRPTERAAPSWTEIIAATAKVHGGTGRSDRIVIRVEGVREVG